MNKSFLVVITLAVVTLVAESGRCDLLVGVGKRIITPDPLLPVSGGMGPPSPAREKKGELTARAMVLQREDVRVAIVSLDVLGFPAVLGELTGQLLTEQALGYIKRCPLPDTD